MLYRLTYDIMERIKHDSESALSYVTMLFWWRTLIDIPKIRSLPCSRTNKLIMFRVTKLCSGIRNVICLRNREGYQCLPVLLSRLLKSYQHLFWELIVGHEMVSWLHYVLLYCVCRYHMTQ
jgi:hypothetical protein